MTEDKKLPDELTEIDWEEALGEWERHTFDEEASNSEPDKGEISPRGEETAAKAPITPRLYIPPPLIDAPPQAETVPIALDSEHLRRLSRIEPSSRSTPLPAKSLSHGGLGQLFARDDRRPSTVPPAAGVQDRLEALRSALNEIAVADVPSPRPALPTLPADEELQGALYLSANGDHSLESPHDTLGTRGGPTDRPPAPYVGSPNEGNLRASLPETGCRASEWLSPSMREAFEARASWIEAEARTASDVATKARMLATCSELLAIVGDLNRARLLAREASELAPSQALAGRQARMLIESRDSEDYFQALDLEATTSPTSDARDHTEWVLADALRAARREDAYRRHLERIGSRPQVDPRAAVACALRSLGEPGSSDQFSPVAADSRTTPISDALAICHRLRGANVSSSSPDDSRTPSELVSRLRRALEARDLPTAAGVAIEFQLVPGVAHGARWLAASLASARSESRNEACRWFEELVDGGNEPARRALVACAFQSGQKDWLTRALAGAGANLASAERVLLSVLGGISIPLNHPHFMAVAANETTRPLATAVSALRLAQTRADTPGMNRDEVLALADLTSGTPRNRLLVRLARLAVMGASPTDLGEAVTSLGSDAPRWMDVLSMEIALRSGRLVDVSLAIQFWKTQSDLPRSQAEAAIASALIAEWAGEPERAASAYKAAMYADPSLEAPLRAASSIENDDPATELLAMADAVGEGLRSALLRIEAIARTEGRDSDSSRVQMLERVGDTPITLLLAAYVGETLARRVGDDQEELRWIRKRRDSFEDPNQRAMDNIREAVLCTDRGSLTSAAGLWEASAARPHDVALRELCEKLEPEASRDDGTWRELAAGDCQDLARTILATQAAYEYEWSRDDEACLRAINAVSTADISLHTLIRERAELRTGNVSRLAEQLLSVARSADDARARREAYERLADIDARTRRDAASALLWHQAILDEFPGYLPSLRHAEHHLLRAGRIDDLEPIVTAIARALRGTEAGEGTAHAELAMRLRCRSAGLGWNLSREMVELAFSAPNSSLSALRIAEADARSRSDDAARLSATLRLIDAANQGGEAAFLLVRAAETALRLGDGELERALLERACLEDPGDVLAWEMLAAARHRHHDAAGMADALESSARASAAAGYQAATWHRAGRIWRDDVQDVERAAFALKTATELDPRATDAFDDLARLYEGRGMYVEVAETLGRRLNHVDDPEERRNVEVRRGRVLSDGGALSDAREAFQSVLDVFPDDAEALSELADVCIRLRDWNAAERALIQLTRLLADPDGQRRAFAALAEIYLHHIVNLGRAQIALQEVRRRDPNDVATAERLIETYRLRGDHVHAVGLAEELVHSARSREERMTRMVALAQLHELTQDLRRAEQVLDAARREFPDNTDILRNLARFYDRHHQGPAAIFLLDRTGGDVRRALLSGRVEPDALEVLATVCELRGRADGARVIRTVSSVLAGSPAKLSGAGARAFDPRFDELLAPELLDSSLRALLVRTGAAMEGALPIDLRALRATAVSPATLPHQLVRSFAAACGIVQVEIAESTKLGATCVPIGASPPIIVVGPGLARNEPVATFLLARACKLVSIGACALARTAPAELGVLVAAWLKCFNPGWEQPGIDPATIHAASARIRTRLPRTLDTDVGLLALEVGGRLGSRAPDLGASALAWGDRVALLATGDLRAALDGIAMTSGFPGGAPTIAADCIAWIAQTPEALDLIAFAVSEAYFAARHESM